MKLVFNVFPRLLVLVNEYEEPRENICSRNEWSPAGNDRCAEKRPLPSSCTVPERNVSVEVASSSKTRSMISDEGGLLVTAAGDATVLLRGKKPSNNKREVEVFLQITERAAFSTISRDNAPTLYVSKRVLLGKTYDVGKKNYANMVDHKG